MGFLENLSEHVGGRQGGMQALADVLSQMAMGAANLRPGESGLGGAARGFAAGSANLKQSFAEGRAFRDRKRLRVTAAEKLQDPSLGAAEREIWSALATGNTAQLEAFQAILGARASDRADKTAEAQRLYYEGKLNAAGRPKPPTNAEIAANREIVQMRKQFIDNPELLNAIDLENPDNDLLRARQIQTAVPDVFGEAFIEWAGQSSLNRGRFEDFVQQRYGDAGLAALQQEYGYSSLPAGGEHGPGSAGAVDDSGSSAESALDAVGATVGNATSSLLDSDLGMFALGTIDQIFGSNFYGRRRESQQSSAAATSEMGSLMDELDAIGRGEDYVPQPTSALVPDDQVDAAFRTIPGVGPQEERDLFLQEYRSKLLGASGAAYDPLQSVVESPGFQALDRGTRQISGAMSEAPRDFIDSLYNTQAPKAAAPGAYSLPNNDMDYYLSGRKAREDFLRGLGWRR